MLLYCWLFNSNEAVEVTKVISALDLVIIRKQFIDEFKSQEAYKSSCHFSQEENPRSGLPCILDFRKIDIQKCRGWEGLLLSSNILRDKIFQLQRKIVYDPNKDKAQEKKELF